MSNTHGKHSGQLTEWGISSFDQPTHKRVRHDDYPAVGRFVERQNPTRWVPPWDDN